MNGIVDFFNKIDNHPRCVPYIVGIVFVMLLGLAGYDWFFTENGPEEPTQILLILLAFVIFVPAMGATVIFLGMKLSYWHQKYLRWYRQKVQERKLAQIQKEREDRVLKYQESKAI